jgi:phosphate transport system permease protein
MDLDSTTIINPTNRETSKTLVSRKRQERGASLLFKCLTFLPVVLFFVILVVLIVRSLPILQQKSVFDLLLGKVWRPSEGEFGFLPFIAGSVWVTVLAMIIAAR